MTVSSNTLFCRGFCCSGYLAYEDIVKQLLDADYYAMYSPAGVDNTQVRIRLVIVQALVQCL